MSSSSPARSSSETRSRCSSMSGRRPAFHESMNSLRTRSRSVVTEDLLQVSLAACAALIDVVDAGVDPCGDLLAGKLFEVGELEDSPVAVVGDLADAPVDEGDRLLAGGLVFERLLVGDGALAQVLLDELVEAAGVAALVAVVEAAAAAHLVAHLRAADVDAGDEHNALDAGAELGGGGAVEVLTPL